MPLEPLLILLLLKWLMLWWMGSPLCTVPLDLPGHCWGALDYVGNSHPGTTKGLYVLSVLVLVHTFCPLDEGCWGALGSVGNVHNGTIPALFFTLAFDLVFLRWFVIACLLSSLPITVLLYLVLSIIHPLTIVWMWWQGSCSSVIPSPPLFGRLPPSPYVDQYVYMLRMHLFMLDKPPIGGWTQLCLLNPNSSSSVSWFITFVSLAFPSSSLSLPLVSKYAQRRVSLHTGLCWHLVFLQTDWDEVKGKCPLVYEDLLSETRNSAYLSFSWFSWFFCSLSGCLIAGLQLNPDKAELETVLDYEAWQHVIGISARLRGPTLVGWCLTVDTWPNPLVYKLRTDKRIEVCSKVFGTPGSTVYKLRTDKRIEVCTNCNISFLEQHLCVLRMCLRALDLHHRMHGPLSYDFVRYGWLCVNCGPFSLCILKFQHRTMFGRLSAMYYYSVKCSP